MKKVLLAVLFGCVTAGAALADTEYTASARNNCVQAANDFHLGLGETAAITDASSTDFDSYGVSYPAAGNTNTKINYVDVVGGDGTDGVVQVGEWATFYYTHNVGSSSVTELRWTKDGVPMSPVGPGNSESGHYGSSSAEWVVGLDNGMHGDYVAEYEVATSQDLTGAVTLSGIEYALTQTPLTPAELEYYTAGGLLTFTPLATSLTLTLGGNQDLPAIAFDPLRDYVVLRYTTQFDGDLYATDSTIYRTSQTAPIPEPATLALLGLGLAGAALRRRRRKRS